MKTVLSKTENLFMKENDELCSRQAVFVCIGAGASILALFYGITYLILLQATITAILCFAYAALIITSLVLTRITKKFVFFSVTQHFAFLFFPPVLHMSLGGFFSAGGVLLWGIFAPFGAYFLRLKYRNFIAVIFLSSCGVCFLYDFRHQHYYVVDPIRCIMLAYLHLFFISLFLIFVMAYYAEKMTDEKIRGDVLLANIFPHSVVNRLKRGELKIIDYVDHASVMFADIVGFSTMADSMEASEVVTMLNLVFTAFDQLAAVHGVEKIKTIGDAYMAGSNISLPNDNHADVLANMALDMIKTTNVLRVVLNRDIHIRIGIASGPLVAGVIGLQHGVFDVYGSTVNLASRMESTSLSDCIQLCEETANLLRKEGFLLQERGSIEVKGLGLRKTYLLQEPIIKF